MGWSTIYEKVRTEHTGTTTNTVPVISHHHITLRIGSVSGNITVRVRSHVTNRSSEVGDGKENSPQCTNRSVEFEYMSKYIHLNWNWKEFLLPVLRSIQNQHRHSCERIPRRNIEQDSLHDYYALLDTITHNPLPAM